MSIAKRAINVCPFVFVYGTLKKGYGNNSLLRTSEFIKETSTKGHYLMVQGRHGIPYVFPKDSVDREMDEYLGPVHGHLYKVDSGDTFYNLDRLEGHPEFYTRSLVELVDGKVAWMYLIRRNTLDDYLNHQEGMMLCHLNSNGSYEY